MLFNVWLVPCPVLDLCCPGHTPDALLTLAAYIILRTVLFRPLPTYTYKTAYTGALLSYAIVVFKSLGYPVANRTWVARAFADENVQYMVLAVYWWISKPIGSESSPLL